MIISCPQCSLRYKVKDDLIGEKGKKVKCKKCSAVFRAYKDRSVLLGGNDQQAAPKKAAPAAPPEAAGSGPQATVKVDRSKVEDFLRNQGGDGDKVQATIKVDASKMQEMLRQNSSEATVQVDRTQIDAFLKKAQPESPPPAPPEQPAGDVGTVKVDRSQLDSFLQQGPEEEAPAPAPAPSIEEMPSTSETVQIDTNALSSFVKDSIQGKEPAPDAASSLEKDDSPFASDTSFAPSPNDGPSFPSDEELGLLPRNQELDKVDLEADTAEMTTVSSEKAAEDARKHATAEIPAVDEPAASEAPAPAPASASASAGETFYVAMVDGAEYPNLTVDSVERWIKEGRLLERDDLALEADKVFKRADEFAEIKPLFLKYYGSREDEAPVQEKPAKKGFFGWLKSLFSKK